MKIWAITKLGWMKEVYVPQEAHGGPPDRVRAVLYCETGAQWFREEDGPPIPTRLEQIEAKFELQTSPVSLPFFGRYWYREV